jgi:2-polyprenyl-3-methyl-5-hydroxy-6-metoxy-1,4-benzoquinol methylase
MGILKARAGQNNDSSIEKAALHGAFVEKYCRLPEQASLLDFGSADGTVLIKLRDKHPQWKILGLEPGVNFRAANERKLDGYFSTLEEIPESQRFDLITLWHVLEHLPHPDRTLSDLARHLNKDGRMAIEVPDEKNIE